MLEYLVSKLEGSATKIEPRIKEVISGIESSYVLVDEKGILLLVDQAYPNDSFQRLYCTAQNSRKNVGAVLLAVAGGSFSEGIDLPGDLLKGVIIVGLPLAKPDLETQELINYYDKRFSKGWDYGYTAPALIKTLQSAGRCIRSETDRGIVVFMDERYVWQNYKKCFSSDLNIIIEKDPIKKIEEFFKK